MEITTTTPLPELAPDLDARERAAIRRLLANPNLPAAARHCAEQGAAFHSIDILDRRTEA